MDIYSFIYSIASQYFKSKQNFLSTRIQLSDIHLLASGNELNNIICFLGRNAERNAYRSCSHDGAKKYFCCDSLLHADRFPDSGPDLDAYTEQHPASDLHCFPDKNTASHLDCIAYAHTGYTESDENSLIHAYPGSNAPHMDPISNTNTASDIYFYINFLSYGTPYALILMSISYIGL